MLNTPWWAWIALLNAAACLWLAVSHLDEMTPGPDAPRWFVLVFRGVAVLCCLVLGGLIALAKVLSDRRRLVTTRAADVQRFQDRTDECVRELQRELQRQPQRPFEKSTGDTT
jgi:hypothetical protein